jgi:hypothetical protein
MKIELILLAMGGALLARQAAAQAIAVAYGPEQTVYGSCRPALTLTNGSAGALDYVEIDMRYRLVDGRVVAAQHKSRYRDGLANPIAPGASHSLVIHPDESMPLGAPCDAIVRATVDTVTCRADDGGDCATALAVAPGADLPLPKR